MNEALNMDVGSNSTANADDIQALENELTQRNADGGEGGGETTLNNHQGGGEEEEEEVEERGGRADTELANAANDEEREAIRARRREERVQKKNRARERVQTLERQVQQSQRQVSEMAQQIALLTQQSAGAQMARLDAAIQEVDQAVSFFENEIADATTKGDGEAVAKATNNLYSARRRKEELDTFKEAVTKQRTSQPARTLDPAAVDHAREFMGKHKWYKGPRGGDTDSRILSVIDNEVMREGFDPTGPEYWQELENRAKQYLPHRFRDGGGDPDEDLDGSRSTQGGGQRGGSGAGKSGYNGRATGGERRTPRQPVAGNSGDASGPKGGGEGFHLSAERVKAIKDAGKWDDPAERKKMIAAYKDYDAKQASRN